MENLQEQHVMAIQCVEHEQFCGQWNSDVRNETWDIRHATRESGQSEIERKCSKRITMSFGALFSVHTRSLGITDV